MKNFFMVLLAVVFCVPVYAQISVPDSYYIERAKKQLQAEEAKKERKIIVIGVEDGMLSYVIRDGERKGYRKEKDKENEQLNFYELRHYTNVKAGYSPLLPFRKKEENNDQNNFAILLRDLTQEGWIIISVTGNAESALYTLERFEKRKR